MIFLTAADAVTALGRNISGGVCDEQTVFDRVNLATRRLLNRPKKPLHIRRLVRFFSKKDTITLPNEISRILHYTMDGAPAPLFSQAYEFVSHGPGELPCGQCGPAYLEDKGDFYATMFDLASMEVNQDGKHCDEPLFSEHKLVALSTAHEDVGKELRIQGVGARNEKLGSAASGVGFALPISQWDSEGNLSGLNFEDLVLSAPVRDVHYVKKPVTAAHVCLCTYDPDTYQIAFLSKYHPDETVPRYRRYRITAPNYTYGHSILAWCELGYAPVSHDDDILLIQNLDALKMMVIALELEDERNFQSAKQYEADAHRFIEDQRGADRTHDYNLIQVSEEYGFSGLGRLI